MKRLCSRGDLDQMCPKWMTYIFAHALMLAFWLIAGIMLAPLWLLVAITGWLLGAYDYREVLRIFADCVMIKWVRDGRR